VDSPVLPEAITKVDGRFSACGEARGLAMVSEASVPGSSSGGVATAHSNIGRANQPVVLILSRKISANVHAS
jgi:hypothetical protein